MKVKTQHAFEKERSKLKAVAKQLEDGTITYEQCIGQLCLMKYSTECAKKVARNWLDQLHNLGTIGKV